VAVQVPGFLHSLPELQEALLVQEGDAQWPLQHSPVEQGTASEHSGGATHWVAETVFSQQYPAETTWFWHKHGLLRSPVPQAEYATQAAVQESGFWQEKF